MNRYFVEVQSLFDWQQRLGNPTRQWKRRASAMELAVAWTNARANERGLPEDVAALLDSQPDLEGARLEIAIPELKTDLDGGAGPSQTDLWARLQASAGTIGLAVEGKAKEPFGDTVSRWLSLGATNGERSLVRRQNRLALLCERLGLDPASVQDFRYQLLHRTVACLLEAEAWGTHSAVMLVHHFARGTDDDAKSWRDFRTFSASLGALFERGGIARTNIPGDIPIYLGWIDRRFADDHELAQAFTGTQDTAVPATPSGSASSDVLDSSA